MVSWCRIVSSVTPRCCLRGRCPKGGGGGERQARIESAGESPALILTSLLFYGLPRRLALLSLRSSTKAEGS